MGRYCSALLCSALAVPISGCAPSDPDARAILGDVPGLAGSRSEEHDLGVVLAEGQTLRHEFTLENPTDRPVRLLRAAAQVPCCSAVESLPGSVPARGEVKVPVVLKPGYQSGLKAVSFTVETDDKERPVLTLVLRARLLAAWEVAPVAGAPTPLALGQAGKQTFRLTARGKGTQSRGLPDEVSITQPLLVAFKGENSTTADGDGLTESCREVEVTIPPASQAGARAGEIAFRWPDGHVEKHRVSWEVRPRLKVSPSGIVLAATRGRVERKVVVSSDGQPFRVLAVRSPILASAVTLPQQAGSRQQLTLSLDLSRAPIGEAVDVRIMTDSPDQPSVRLSVIVPHVSKGTEP